MQTAQNVTGNKIAGRIIALVFLLIVIIVLAAVTVSVNQENESSDSFAVSESMLYFDDLHSIGYYGTGTDDDGNTEYYTVAYYVNDDDELNVVTLIINENDDICDFFLEYMDDELIQDNFTVSGYFTSDSLSNYTQLITPVTDEEDCSPYIIYYSVEESVEKYFTDYCEDTDSIFMYSDTCLRYAGGDPVVMNFSSGDSVPTGVFVALGILFLINLFSLVSELGKRKKTADKNATAGADAGGHECYGQFTNGDYEEKAGYKEETYTVDKGGNVHHSGDCYGQISEQDVTPHTVRRNSNPTGVKFKKDKRDPEERTPIGFYGNERTCPHCGSPVKRRDRFCEECGGKL